MTYPGEGPTESFVLLEYMAGASMNQNKLMRHFD